jgi:hypothetical protein
MSAAISKAINGFVITEMWEPGNPILRNIPEKLAI